MGTPSQAEPEAGAPASRARLAIGCALGLILWLELVFFPVAPQAGLDPSWNAVLIYASSHGWQFGRDIVFTAGPWGYLTGVVHLGAMEGGSRLAWELAGKLAVAALLVASTRRLPAACQALFLLGCIWLGWLFLGTFALVVITVIVVEEMLRGDARQWCLAACSAGLAFLGLMKFTNLMLATAGVGAAVALQLSLRRWKRAACTAAAYALALLVFWALAGQQFEFLVPYLKTSLEISRGYADSMGVDEDTAAFLLGSALALLWVVFLFDVARNGLDRRRSLAASAFLAAAAFVIWKHGFIRADGHKNGFYLITFLLAIILPVSLMPRRRWHWFWVAGLVGLVGFRVGEPAIFPQCAGISLNRVLDNARALKRVPSMLDQWSGELRAAETAAYLPRINAAVGSGSMDLVSFDQGLVLMNELNYAPRPIFQSYSAYTPALSALNAEFYRSASAPKFVMWHQESIDARFPTTEDAQLMLELPRGYVTELEEGGYLLLRRVREIPDHPPRRELLSERQALLGDSVAVPPLGRGPIWLQVIMRPSLLGFLRAALYKPAQMRIRAVDSGGSHTEWRMLPDVAGDGFLLSPLLATTSDFGRFLRDGGGSAVATVQFVAPGGQEKFWDRRITVRFWSLPDLERERQAAAKAGAEAGN